MARWRSLGGRKLGITFLGLSVIFSSRFWFTIPVLLGRIFAREASKGPPSMSYSAIMKRLFPTFLSSAALSSRLGTSGRVCGDVRADMFLPCLSFGTI